MKASFNAAARKRPVNLTLNTDLVSHAKSMTDNLSAVVESLLSEFVERESRERLVKAKVVEATVAAWNRFNDKSGSIADEYSSL
ncbi:MAG: type II toxin-antitoxin system CcdA family antitoxin [Steroidobacteraceae bacterium]|jgi:antitoxin CcdA